MSESRDVVSVSRVIDASPEAIFALLADPRRHCDIDGSGTVGEAKDLPDRLRLGSTFGMSMKRGVHYSTVNEVVEFDEGRRIAWQPHMRAFAWVSGGRVWRYELEPVDGGTLVRETWDISQEKGGSKWLVGLGGARKKTGENMAKTLENIERIVTT